jgi:hypothetical protein
MLIMFIEPVRAADGATILLHNDWSTAQWAQLSKCPNRDQCEMGLRFAVKVHFLALFAKHNHPMPICTFKAHPRQGCAQRRTPQLPAERVYMDATNF